MIKIRPVFISLENARKITKGEMLADRTRTEGDLLFWAYNFYGDIIKSASEGFCTCEISYIGINESFNRFIAEFNEVDLMEFFPGIQIKIDKKAKAIQFNWSQSIDKEV